MGKYDDAAEQAMNQASEELKDEINELINVDVQKLFPNVTDQALVNELIAEVQKSTSHNEMVTACQTIAVKLTAEGVKAFKEGFSIAKKLAI